MITDHTKFDDDLLDGEFFRDKLFGTHDITLPHMYNFDVSKFGEAFLRCSGKLNNKKMSHDNAFGHGIIVVGRTIGITLPRYKRASYATAKNALLILNEQHIGLTNRKEALAAIEDFYKFKLQIIRKYKKLKKTVAESFKQDMFVQEVENLNCESFVDIEYSTTTSNTITINMPAASPSPAHRYHHKAFIRHDNITVILKNNQNYLMNKNYMPDYSYQLNSHYSRGMVDIEVCSSIPQFPIISVSLLPAMRNGIVYPRDYSGIDNHMNKISGFDIFGAINNSISLHNEFVSWYEMEIVKLIEKYSYEYFMNSIGEDDCLI